MPSSLAATLYDLLTYNTSRVYALSALCVAACTIFFVRKWMFRVNTASFKVIGDVDKSRREYGEWTPVEFKYPEIRPALQELKDIKPIPYRPFRWGKYNVTMGIRNMSWNEWIELDSQYETYQRIRKHRIQTRGPSAIRVLGDDVNPGVVHGGGEAAIELVHELAEYLSRRYPQSFKIERHIAKTDEPLGWNDLPSIKEVTVIPLSTTHRLPLNINDGERAPERAMEIAALLIQDDLALMVEGTDGRYYFQAGAICVPGFWRMKDKIGLPLDEIHLTGNVPQYREKLHTSLERFFRRLTVDKPVTRNNFFIQVVRSQEELEKMQEENIDPEELGWSESSNGPEDDFENGHAFAGPLPNQLSPTPATLRMRTERQTLRRLPRTGAIVFTIRTYVVAIKELAKERGVPGRMASGIRGWGADIAEYKGMERNGWRDILLQYLDGQHQKQVERGEIGIEERAGEGEYPY
ncbi:hypothetical protein BDQ17DRAFT_1275100 [Cyathus striatus]|nr:hypothetical protein BDQ17DRAFT_1275100 [Cyathus striatus]